MSRIQQITRQFRSQLMAHDAAAARTLINAYVRSLGQIQPYLNKLYQDMRYYQQRGEQMPVSWLYESRRLETIKQVVLDAINQYGRLTQAQVAELQRAGVQLGTQSSQSLLQANVPPGISYAFGVPDTHALESLVGAMRPGSPLYDLFRTFGPQAADNVGKALLTGLTLGNSPRDVARGVASALDIPRVRALTIARTEGLRAYRSAQLANFQANSDVVDQWRWTADKSTRTCAACIAMDGTLHPLDEEMASHVNCRCTTVPITKSWSDILGPFGVDTSTLPDTRPTMQSGSDWLDNQDEDVQRNILGAKYEGWKNDDFDLLDLVGHSTNADWGHSIYVKTLAQVTKGK